MTRFFIWCLIRTSKNTKNPVFFLDNSGVWRYSESAFRVIKESEKHEKCRKITDL